MKYCLFLLSAITLILLAGIITKEIRLNAVSSNISQNDDEQKLDQHGDRANYNHSSLNADKTLEEGPLQIPSAMIDRGLVKIAKPLKVKFDLHNPTSDNIIIHQVTRECGCLTPQLSNKIITAGKTETLTLEINTLSQPPGKREWQDTILYRIGSKMEKTYAKKVIFRAELVREIQISPAAILLSTTDSEIQQSIHIKDERKKGFQIKSIRCSIPGIDCKKTQGEASQNPSIQHELTVTVTKKTPIGFHEAKIQIDTDDPEYSILEVPFRVVKKDKSQISASTDRLFFQLGKDQSTASRLVCIGDGNHDAIALERIETDSSEITTKSANGPGKMVTVRVGIQLSEMSKKTFQKDGLVKIYIKEPKPQLIVLPVHWEQKEEEEDD